MAKIPERCPHCGAEVSVYKTDTVPAMPGDNWRGLVLHKVRYQSVRCPQCGLTGNRHTFISHIDWHIDINVSTGTGLTLN